MADAQLHVRGNVAAIRRIHHAWNESSPRL